MYFKRIIIADNLYPAITALSFAERSELISRLIMVATDADISVATNDMPPAVGPVFYAIHAHMVTEYDAHRRGGLLAAQSAKARIPSPVIYPENLVPPSDCINEDFYDPATKILHKITPVMMAVLRYICLVRDYNLLEINKMTNTFFRKFPAQGKPLAYDEELLEKAAVWVHYGKETHRFSFAPFHSLVMKLIHTANDTVISAFLKKRFDAEIEGCILFIYCDEVLIEFFESRLDEVGEFSKNNGINKVNYRILP